MALLDTTTASSETGFRLQHWNARLPELAAAYRSGEPFPHIHLTDLVSHDRALALAAEVPPPSDDAWSRYRHVNEDKLGLNKSERFPPTIREAIDELNSPRFVAWLSALTGIERLVPDPSLEGGGLHQTESGGFLNVHTDFTTHYHRRSWRRRVNLILYLNEGWKEEWKGSLELWDREMKRCVRKVPPLLNNAIIFSTTEAAYHGYPDRICCPETVTRKSIALYYYTIEEGSSVARATNYRARPGDGVLKSAAIWVDKVFLHAYTRIKRALGLSDSFASAVLKRLPSRRPRRR
jgi:hypothetical protein